MKLLSVIWLCFSLLFASLSYFHYQQSKTAFNKFQWEAKNYPFGSSVNVEALETKHNLQAFLNQWDKYIDGHNRATRQLNIAATIGYFFSARIALISPIIVSRFRLVLMSCYIFKIDTHMPVLFKSAKAASKVAIARAAGYSQNRETIEAIRTIVQNSLIGKRAPGKKGNDN